MYEKQKMDAGHCETDDFSARPMTGEGNVGLPKNSALYPASEHGDAAVQAGATSARSGEEDDPTLTSPATRSSGFRVLTAKPPTKLPQSATDKALGCMFLIGCGLKAPKDLGQGSEVFWTVSTQKSGLDASELGQLASTYVDMMRCLRSVKKGSADDTDYAGLTKLWLDNLFTEQGPAYSRLVKLTTNALGQCSSSDGTITIGVLSQPKIDGAVTSEVDPWGGGISSRDKRILSDLIDAADKHAKSLTGRMGRGGEGFWTKKAGEMLNDHA